MSTRGESPGDSGRTPDPPESPGSERGLSAEFEAIIAAVLVSPERRALVRAALGCADEVRFMGSVEDLVEADVDLAVVDYASLADLTGEQQRSIEQRCRAKLDPIRVVIDVPKRSRVGLLTGVCVDLVVEPGVEALELLTRIWALLRRARLERDRNPLTGLPGNRWLRRQISERLIGNRAVGLLLLDIDDFKRYNDLYGQLRGDRAIEALAHVAGESADACAGACAAHIGGDDFCIVCPPEALDDLAARCLRALEMQLRVLEGAAALTVTAAGTIAAPAEVDALEDTFARLARLKAEGKDRSGSSYVRDG